MSLGIYIHIPFCKRKCAYCDFLSSDNLSDEERYLDSLKQEIVYYADTHEGDIVDTVFIGGGTPSVLRTGAISEIIDTLSKSFTLSNHPEITVEANPDTLSADKVSEYSQFATRVSVGVQSLSDDVLKVAGRLHDKETALRALSDLTRTNLDISCDIILGLPLDSVKGVEFTTKTLLDTGITHLSAYGLKVEKGTKFHKWLERGEINFLDDDTVADAYDRVVDIAKSYGLNRYEVSNFAKPTKECKHNIGYWQRKDYLGLGLGAHSLLNNVRYENTRNINDYLNTQDFVKVRNIESKLTYDDRLFEEIMLGLRLSDGIDVNKINEKYGIDFYKRFSKPIDKLKRVLECSEQKMCVKEQYFYALNSIIVEFLD